MAAKRWSKAERAKIGQRVREAAARKRAEREAHGFRVATTAKAQQDAADGEVFHMPTVEIDDTPLAAHGDAAELVRAAVRLLRDLAAPTMLARKRAVEHILYEALAILVRDV